MELVKFQSIYSRLKALLLKEDMLSIFLFIFLIFSYLI